MAWTSPRTWVAGESVTAALLNTHLRDNLKAIGDAWSSYSPSSSSWGVGNGTLTGKYIAAGKLVFARLRFEAGSTSTFAAGNNWGLPVNVGVVTNEREPIGLAQLYDASAGAYRTWSVVVTGSGLCAVTDPTTGGVLTTTSPWTWASGDRVSIAVQYEAA